MSATILLAEADPTTRAFLVEQLTADGYTVIAVASDYAAITELGHGQDAVDLLAIDGNGHTLTVVDAVRDSDDPLDATPTDLPVIALTSHTEQLHRVRLLQRGADDVIVKPLGYPELHARIAAVLRRTNPRQNRPVIVAGDVRADLYHRRVTVRGRPVALTATEYRLLCALGAEPHRVFTRAELLGAVWGHQATTHTRTLDSFAYRLRRKLATATHPVVVNAWGVGLSLLPAELPTADTRVDRRSNDSCLRTTQLRKDQTPENS